MENKLNQNEKSDTAYVNGSGNVHIRRKRVLADKNINYEFNKFYNTEILKLLINVYEESIAIPELRVINMFNLHDTGIGNMPKHKDDDLWSTSGNKVVCEFEYNSVYYISFFRSERDRYAMKHYYIDFGFEMDSIPEEKIGHELLRLAFSYTSSYKKGCVEISFTGDRPAVSGLDVAKTEPPKCKAKKIFINEETKTDIERFIYTFKNFDKYKNKIGYFINATGFNKKDCIEKVRKIVFYSGFFNGIKDKRDMQVIVIENEI